jgi:predicted alpha/beta-hydrolase family hydrolase
MPQTEPPQARPPGAEPPGTELPAVELPAVELVDTPRGPARLRWSVPAGAPRGTLLLGHGAGGSVEAPDLVAVTAAAVGDGWVVVRVEQPYRVAGRRAPAPAGQLDQAWLAVSAALRPRAGQPLVLGGRSSGARVACRTAAAAGAAGVVCLAFPLHPPGRPEKSRLAELDAVTVPVLVVQGERDPFGLPPPAAGRTVQVLPGADHALRTDPAAVGAVVTGWLAALTADRGRDASPNAGHIPR